jgi:hypothetical protein
MTGSYGRIQAEACARPAGATPGPRGAWARLGAVSLGVLAYGFPALILAALALGNLGCSSGNAQVEEVVWKFVDAIKKQDVATLDKIIDWERYYAYGKKENGGSVSDIDVDKEKNLLLSVLARDRVLAVNYLTARSSIANLSVKGDEAQAEVLQVDRATGESRTVTLLLHKEENGVWKIYRFSTSAQEEDESR